jgi:FkbM family methyltransferase
MNMLKSTCKAALNMVAPKIYASLKFSRARQSFPEDELHIAPLLCDKTKTSIDIGACGGIYTAHIVNASRDCLAFEPNPKESSKLVEMITNLSLPVRVETLALSDSLGKASLRIPEKDGGRSTWKKLSVQQTIAIIAKSKKKCGDITYRIRLMPFFNFNEYYRKANAESFLYHPATRRVHALQHQS